MKIVQLLSTGAFIAALSAAPVLADSMSGQIQAPGQPFTHPTDDTSYTENLHEDGAAETSTTQTEESEDDTSDDEPYVQNPHEDDAAGTSATRVVKSGNVSYVSGGVDETGMDNMKTEQDAYNLKTTFVMEPNGEYLSEVNVKIATTGDEDMLNTRTDGPVLLAQLPPGHYVITAMSKGSHQTLTKHVKIDANHLSECVFHFRSEEG